MKSNLAKDFRISSCISKIIILSLYKEKRLEQDVLNLDDFAFKEKNVKRNQYWVQI